jgi:methionine-rich copper-binding protein CopC
MNYRVTVALLALACSATPSFAHAFLKHAEPGAGAALKGSPQKVVLVFTEQLEPVFSGVIVTNAAGQNVEAGTAVIGGNTMVAPLRTLGPGRYRVVWHAVSVDTHRTEGAYSFTVRP